VKRPPGDQLYEFAVKMAGWFCRGNSLRGGQRDDILQDMLVGMSQATTRYDASRGVPFETFARKRMIGEAIDGLARRGGVPRSSWARGVRRPQSLVNEVAAPLTHLETGDMDRMVDVRRAYGALNDVSPLLRRTVEAVHAENATPSELASELGLSKAQVSQFLVRGLQLIRSAIQHAGIQQNGETMNSNELPAITPAQWRAELRKTVRKLVTPEIIEQLVLRQIELAKAGDRYALTFLLKQCGLHEATRVAAVAPPRTVVLRGRQSRTR
jgi:RNA polymerase sigma factor (sigma-70 family)